VSCARQIIVHDASVSTSSGSNSIGDNKNKATTAQEALEHLTVLKGVGPATASAILSLVRPDVYCYMYDEVIDCFENKR
jgi:3-methyladenine DNA glycosylase/8-oxoguanine DNA glycosylase